MKRRIFIRNSAAALAGTFAVPAIVPSTVFGNTAPGNKINIGQIGCGRMGRGDIMGTIRFDRARLVAVCDVDSRRMADGKKLIEDYYSNKTGSNRYIDVKMYDDYRDMLKDPDIDAVIISTPDHWHEQPAMEAALMGKDIYLQKPNSLTVAAGRQMSDVVQRQGVILQVGTQQRSSEQFRLAAELVRNGRIGKLHTVKVGLPGDPSGPEAPPMPVPPNLDFDRWLGSTPVVPYTETGVHPQNDYGRPGWLRLEAYGSGMITGWGQHHYDSAAWGMDTEYSGPVSVEAVAEFPKSGLWNVHGDFMVKAEYEDGVTMYTSGGFPNGIRYEGTEGWIFVSRGSYTATASDPVSAGESRKALDASDPRILEFRPGPDDINLYRSTDHYGDWLESIVSRRQPVCNVETGHRACTVCLISHIAMKIPGRLEWDARSERFRNNDLANSMLSRPQRYPYGTNFVQLQGF